MTDDIVARLREYLASGGLFNPELMDHAAVRDLLIDCRHEIGRLRAALREIAKHDTDADGNWGFFRDEADAALEGEKKDD